MKEKEYSTLHLTLKKKWFDMIASGEKKEEYREIKQYWGNRLQYNPGFNVEKGYCEPSFRGFDQITARNGYATNSPVITWRHKGIRIGKPNPAWCEPEDVNKNFFILEIGEILNPSVNNEKTKGHATNTIV